MVARERDELPCIILDGDAETVGIGVGAEHDVCLDPVRKVDAHRKGLLVFGIGDFDSGEFGVLHRLFLHDGDVDAELLQNGHDGHITRAVDGGIDEF